MKVVVIGATGNLGTSTLDALIADPRVSEIVGVARRKPRLALDKVRFERADVASDDLTPLLQGADVLIHLAWAIQPVREADRLYRVNVQGSERVFWAAAEAGVRSIVYASSVGAYSRGPKDRHVDESWPVQGISTALYSRHKAQVEQILDEFERAHPQIRVVRMRPGLVFKREAASEIRRLFIGPFVPRFMFRADRIPVVPDVEGLRFQCVHSYDVGRAFALAATSDARGAYNLAADPVIDSAVLAELLGARRVRMRGEVLRRGVQMAWRLHLTPIDRGWIDIALGVPLMDWSRARSDLGWVPRHTSTDALMEVLTGIHDGSGLETAPLHA